jgi:hypothetical protein
LNRTELDWTRGTRQREAKEKGLGRQRAGGDRGGERGRVCRCASGDEWLWGGGGGGMSTHGNKLVIIDHILIR